MLNLQVTIDTNSGFCFGVVYAIAMAEAILDSEKSLYCLGDIVHNDEEVKRLEAKGLKIINYDDIQAIYDQKVLIRAHGEPPSTYQLALQNNLELIDASCPVVLKLQNRIKNSYDKQEKIFIFGKQGHAEVIGLLGQTNDEAVVFQDLEALESHILPEKITLYSQTTKSKDKFYAIAKTLQQRGHIVEINDTICRQVSNRDAELRIFARKFDKIIFVSGLKSSNGKVLYQVCKDINPQSYFIVNDKDLNNNWFEVGNTVGICGATSTPMWLMEEIKKELEKL
jgi:4-hydroxy-3-methylbut-2-en-1-yl diphosphate reductase